MRGNLLGREVTRRGRGRRPSSTTRLALKTTGDITTVDGGNIAAALR